MSETLYVAVIAAGAAILASAVAGFFTYFATARQRESERYKRRLVQAYRDIIAFYRLEEQYVKALSNESRTPEAIKREARKQLRDSGSGSPSEDATPQQCERRIRELS